jgi:hypothetical protein
MFYAGGSHTDSSLNYFHFDGESLSVFDQSKLLRIQPSDRAFCQTDIHFADLSFDSVLSASPEDYPQVPEEDQWLLDVNLADLEAALSEDSNSNTLGQLNFPSQSFGEVSNNLSDHSTLVDAAWQRTSHHPEHAVNSMPIFSGFAEVTWQPHHSPSMLAEPSETNKMNDGSEAASLSTM